MKIKPTLPPILAALLAHTALLSSALAANWYVDNAANGSNDGTSWSDAWESLSAISWASVAAGDTIYISGGSSSKTYSGTLTIGKSGTSNSARITITRGTDTGHDGRAIISSSATRGIEILNHDYVTLSHLEVQMSASDGRGVYIDDSSHITVDACTFPESKRAGVFVQESSQVIVSNNFIETPVYFAAQTDGIYSQRNSNNTYHGNEIYIRNTEVNGHDDVIQSFTDVDMTFYNNRGEQINTKQFNAQGIFCEAPNGTFVFYNNIMIAPNSENSMITMKLPVGSAYAYVYSNTLIGGNNTIRLLDCDGGAVKNNIAWKTTSGNPTPYLDTGSTGIAVSNNWFSVGGDPLLDSDFIPLSGSPVIDGGASLSSPYDIDWLGTARPQGSAFDIGAGERNATVTGGAIRIETGGTASFTDGAGQVWSVDQYAVGGTMLDRGSISIANTTDDRIYQTERYGMSAYNIPVASGTYTVRLHLAETSPSIKKAGQRVFSVTAEGTSPAGWSNIDLFFECGGKNKARIKTATVVVTDGTLNLGFTASANSAVVNGIEVIPGSTVRLETGATTAFTDLLGSVYAADQHFTGGTTVDRGSIAIANTLDDKLYQTERYGMTSYDIPVANGTYTVRLHLAETSPSITGAGQRIFTVTAEGATPSGWSNMDLYVIGGNAKNVAIVRSATVTVSDGTLNLGFSASANNPLINAIEVTPQ